MQFHLQQVFQRTRKEAIWIFLLAVVVRLIFIIAFPKVDEGELMDSTRYKRVAINLIEGKGFTEYGDVPTAFSPPLYPFFLAGVFKIFGQSNFAVKVIQAILSGLTCLVILQIATILFNRRVGYMSAILVAIYPELIALSGYLYTETLFIFLVCTAFLFLLKAFAENGNLRLWIAGGFFLGLSILTRHLLLLFPVFLFFTCLLFRKNRTLWKQIIVFSAVCYLVMAPWIIRNYIVFEEFIPVATGVGGGLFMGSHIQYEGGYNYQKTVKLLIDESRGAKSYADRDGILMRKALKNIFDHPWEYSKIVLKKIGSFFFQIYQNIPLGRQRQFDLRVTLGLAVSYYPILLFFLIGLYLSRDMWKILLPIYAVIVYSSLLYSVIIFTPRYRTPFIPFFVLIAGFALDRVLIKNVFPWFKKRIGYTKKIN